MEHGNRGRRYIWGVKVKKNHRFNDHFTGYFTSMLIFARMKLLNLILDYFFSEESVGANHFLKKVPNMSILVHFWRAKIKRLCCLT